MPLDRDSSLQLIAATHTFPGPFDFRVVTRPAGKAAALAAVLSTVGGSEALLSVSERPSQGGNYVSLRIRVQLAEAGQVLDVYEVLKGMPEVITAL